MMPDRPDPKQQAVEAGYQAYVDYKTLDDNPYANTGPNGHPGPLSPYWAYGWEDAQSHYRAMLGIKPQPAQPGVQL